MAGIGLTGTNFTVGSPVPLDDRDIAADITARNAITPIRRFIGLEVFVTATATKYRLVGGILDANWVALTDSGGISNSDSIINALIFG